MSPTDYIYRSAQQSILRPLYRRLFWNRVLDALPQSLSPNTMTLISTACCAASFVLAVTLRESALALSTAAVLVIAYLTLDNLDGAQARRVGRSTRLGEFLDHWLDTLNNGFVVLGACFAAGLPLLLTLGVICFGTLAFFAVQWELRHTGVFRMGRIADIEGNTTVALLYATLAVFGADSLHFQLVPQLPTVAVLIGCGVMAQSIWTVLMAVVRVRSGHVDFAPAVFAQLAVVSWAAFGGLSLEIALVIAFFLNPVFTSRPVLGRLLGRVTPALDRAVAAGLATAAIAGALGWSAGYDDAIGAATAAVLLGVTLHHFSVAVRALRSESRVGPGEIGPPPKPDDESLEARTSEGLPLAS